MGKRIQSRKNILAWMDANHQVTVVSVKKTREIENGLPVFFLFYNGKEGGDGFYYEAYGVADAFETARNCFPAEWAEVGTIDDIKPCSFCWLAEYDVKTEEVI